MRNWTSNLKQRFISFLLTVLEAVISWLYKKYDWSQEPWYDSEEMEYSQRLADLKEELVRIELEQHELYDRPGIPMWGRVKELNDQLTRCIHNIQNTEMCLAMIDDERAYQYTIQ